MILPHAQYKIISPASGSGNASAAGPSIGAPVHKNFAIILQAIVYNRYAVLSLHRPLRRVGRSIERPVQERPDLPNRAGE